MKASTLWQPFASLVACGHKTIETRGYPPPRGLIGQRIAIHAAKRELDTLEWTGDFWGCVFAACGDANYNDWLRSIPFGAVVATARLACAHEVGARVGLAASLYSGTHPGEEKACAHWKGWQSWPATTCACGDFSVGRWLWFLDEIEPLDKPVPARGYQGWWEWSP